MSEVAVNIMKKNEDFELKRCNAFPHDIANFPLKGKQGGEGEGGGVVEGGSVDIATMIFMLSAVAPSKMGEVLGRVREVIRPGGHLLIRDYGVCDLAHVRFMAKQGRKLEENFYLRGGLYII